MKKEMNEEIVKIPLELAKKIQTELNMTPGSDFNTLLVQALGLWFSGKHDHKVTGPADFKDRCIKDSSRGYGPRANLE